MSLLDSIPALLREAVGWITAHGPMLVVASGALLIAGAAVLVWRAYRTDRLADVATWFTVAIATAYSAEGMWEVAREGLDLNPWQAAGLFGVAEAAMTSEAIRARRHYKRHGRPGPHGAAVWVIATCAGVIATLNADSLVEAPVRLLVPLLAAWLWWLELTSEGIRRQVDTITWRLSPRRILVRLGLAEPGERDVVEVDRARRIALLTAVAYRLHHGWKPLRTFHSARLRRLALGADDAMVDEARTRVDRAHHIATLTAPGTQPSAGNAPDGIPARTTTSVSAAAGDRSRQPRAPHAGAASSNSRPSKSAAGSVVRMGDHRGRPDSRVRGEKAAVVKAYRDRVLSAEGREPGTAEISRQTGVSDRTVRDVVAKLRTAQHGQAGPIGHGGGEVAQ
ncbi:hypothetical protein ABN034_12530 [Actinopolymorpha sp. B11F2]|uniref:hypothetical protein n=1 Tax=Actinopolymorpha sp. B11F2 TaxID=3160862 RepID=UPI0032E4C014